MLLMLGGCCLTTVSGEASSYRAASSGGFTPTGGAPTGGETTLGGGGATGTAAPTSGGSSSGGGTAEGSTSGGGGVTSGASTTSAGSCVPATASNLRSEASYGQSIATSAMVSGDINGDGLLDLVVAESVEFYEEAADFVVFLGQADGGLSAPEVPDRDGGLSAPDASFVGNGTAIALADLDNNGWPDVIVSFGANIHVFLNEGGEKLNDTAFVQTLHEVFGIGIGDLNGDGFEDLVLAEYENTGAGAIELVFGSGSGGFSAPVLLPGVGGTRFPNLVVADLNQDGLPDIATNTSDGSQLAVLLNQGDGGFMTTLYPTPVTAQLALLPRAGTAPDLIVGTVQLGSFEQSGTVQILKNSGDGHFSIGPSYTAPGAMFFAVGDFNGDCIPDIATSVFWNCQMLGSGISVLYGDGQGGFEPPVSLQAVGSATAGLAVLGPIGSPRALAVVDACGAGVTVYGDASQH